MGSQGPELFNSELHGLSARQHIVIPDLLTSQGYLSHKSDSLGESPTTYMTASWFSATMPLLHTGVAHVNSSDTMKVAASQKQVGLVFITCQLCLQINVERWETALVIFAFTQGRPH